MIKRIFLLITVLGIASLAVACNYNNSNNIEITTQEEETHDYNLEEYTEKFVDFDDMCFYVNGKKYVLGKTTPQEMIDDGVSFTNLAVAGYILESNSELDIRSNLKIALDNNESAYISVFNDSDIDKAVSECCISEIFLENRRGEKQNTISFNFPIDITVKDFLEKAGEASDRYHVDGDDNSYADCLRYVHKVEKDREDKEYYLYFLNGKINHMWLKIIH